MLTVFSQRSRLLGVFALIAGLTACGQDEPVPERISLTREQMLDPETCKSCHEKHYEEWSGSMHAYATHDPVFIAMNQRGQRETAGDLTGKPEAELGSFCVNCHAPMAVRELPNADWKTQKLEELPAALRGITCYFCHNMQSVDGLHNNQITLANDLTMRGAIRDPLPNGAHHSAYSELTDRDQMASADACGSCHDLHLVPPISEHEIALERTYEEWKVTTFAKPEFPQNKRCGSCHMFEDLEVIATFPGVDVRKRHQHDFPGIDVAFTPFPESNPQNSTQAEGIQIMLRTTLVVQVCVSKENYLGAHMIDVQLDNAGAGHNFPSGASQDRRVWMEVTAYNKAGESIYQSGQVKPQEAVPSRAANPDFFLLRDYVYKKNGDEAHMFWEVAQTPRPQDHVTISGQRPVLDGVPHVVPHTFSGPATEPDRVSVLVRMRPIDYDVVDDLIASRDLDPEVRNQLKTFDVVPDPTATSTFDWALAASYSTPMAPKGSQRRLFNCSRSDGTRQ